MTKKAVQGTLIPGDAREPDQTVSKVKRAVTPMDPELLAMRKIDAILTQLPADSAWRAIKWASAKQESRALVTLIDKRPTGQLMGAVREVPLQPPHPVEGF